MSSVQIQQVAASSLQTQYVALQFVQTQQSAALLESPQVPEKFTRAGYV